MIDVLRLHGVRREFGPGIGVIDVDLDVAAGEIHALVGLNGAGKSTLMRLALDMLRPVSGSVEVLGQPLGRATRATWSQVGHLVGAPAAYGELSVRTNLLAAARLHGLARSECAGAVDRVLDELALREYEHRRFRALSSGNAQRVGLAAALVHRPRLVVLDEPTNALDPAGVVLLRNRLLELAADGTGVLVSSHHLDEVARVATRVTLMNRGHVVGTLDPSGSDLEREFFARLLEDDRVRGHG